MLDKANLPISWLERLPIEILVLIQLAAGDPITFGRTQCLKKTLYNRLNEHSASFWQFLLKRDFPKFPLPLNNSSLGPTNYRQLYIDQLKDRKKLNNLLPHQEQLLNFIRWNYPGIRWQDYSVDENTQLGTRINDFIDVCDKEGLNAISLASQNGRHEILKAIYQHMVNTVFSNAETDYEGRKQFHWAIYCGMVTDVKELIKTENVNQKYGTKGLTPLCSAVEYGRSEIVTLLLNAKADVNQAMNDGATPLYIAAGNGHPEVVTQLLSAHANVNQARITGATPLLIAAHQGHREVVKQLLNAKADVNQAGNNGATPLYIAAQNGHSEIVKQLLNANASVNQAMNDGSTPLFIAAHNGYTEIITMLLNANADVNQTTNDGATPLFIAAQKGYPEVVTQLLLNENANVNRAMNDDATPLFIAAQNGHLQVVTQLLNANANVNQAANDGTTPLFIAAQEGHTEVVKQLLNANANVNQTMNDGATPLFIAAHNGHLRIVELLLAKGAAMLPVNDNKTPLMIAIEKKHSAIVTLLMLWSIKLATKNQPVHQQVIEILKTSLNLRSSPINLTFFLNREAMLIRGITQLPATTHQDESDLVGLKKWLQDLKTDLPVEKFEFIMKYILSEDSSKQEQSVKREPPLRL